MVGFLESRKNEAATEVRYNLPRKNSSTFMSCVLRLPLFVNTRMRARLEKLYHAQGVTKWIEVENFHETP